MNSSGKKRSSDEPERPAKRLKDESGSPGRPWANGVSGRHLPLREPRPRYLKAPVTQATSTAPVVSTTPTPSRITLSFPEGFSASIPVDQQLPAEDWSQRSASSDQKLSMSRIFTVYQTITDFDAAEKFQHRCSKSQIERQSQEPSLPGSNLQTHRRIRPVAPSASSPSGTIPLPLRPALGDSTQTPPLIVSRPPLQIYKLDRTTASPMLKMLFDWGMKRKKSEASRQDSGSRPWKGLDDIPLDTEMSNNDATVSASDDSKALDTNTGQSENTGMGNTGITSPASTSSSKTQVAGSGQSKDTDMGNTSTTPPENTPANSSNKTPDNAKDVETANTSGTPPESNEQDSQTQSAGAGADSEDHGMNDHDSDYSNRPENNFFTLVPLR